MTEDEWCHHCGKTPEADGDHSCDCPFTDSECLEHTLNPVTEDERRELGRRMMTDHGCIHHQGPNPTGRPCRACTRRVALIEEFFARIVAAHRADLEAEVERLTTALADSEETAANLNRRRWENFNAATETQREVERLRGVVARVEALADEWEYPAEVYALRMSAAPRIREILGSADA